ncbi:Hypothetical predicted protein [Paramuricea clavata]|uniref:QRICH1-like domain-containing protein n=1 Tax=Paramuricea clavata TaxID=317549 RepID=A0A7D9LYD9_PARCT|nr:Hypothetical predicted protein [Paramuricea clavata]
MYDINVIKRYFESIYETREIENIPAKELNVQLAKFFMNVRKRNGSVYEPTSLKDFQRSLQRYLNDKSSTMNILQDQVFAKSREVLIAKKRELVQQHAKGNRPQACRELTTAEEDKFFELGLFGKHDPEVLQRTVCGFFLFISAFERQQQNLSYFNQSTVEGMFSGATFKRSKAVISTFFSTRAKVRSELQKQLLPKKACYLERWQ